MVRFGWSMWFVEGAMVNKVGNVSMTRLKMGFSAFTLEAKIGGDSENREVMRWSGCIMKEDRKFSEGHIGFEMYQEPSCWIAREN